MAIKLPNDLTELRARLVELESIKGLNQNDPSAGVLDLNAPVHKRLWDSVNNVLAGGNPVGKKSIARQVQEVERGIQEQIDFAVQKTGEDKAALANRTDYTRLTPAQIAKEEKAGAKRNQELREVIALREGNLRVLAQAFPDAGIELPPEPVRVASGFIPASEAKEKDIIPSIGQRFGEPLITKQAADGTWGVYGTDSGKLIEGGFSSQIIADQAATRLNLGTRKIGEPEPAPLPDAKARETELAKESDEAVEVEPAEEPSQLSPEEQEQIRRCNSMTAASVLVAALINTNVIKTKDEALSTLKESFEEVLSKLEECLNDKEKEEGVLL